MINQVSVMAEDTKDRLAMTAMRLFSEKGYESTSVADILRAAGANSGSLYHFFQTKQDLLMEVLRRYRDGIGPMLLGPAWEGIDDPIERLVEVSHARGRPQIREPRRQKTPRPLDLDDPPPDQDPRRQRPNLQLRRQTNRRIFINGDRLPSQRPHLPPHTISASARLRGLPAKARRPPSRAWRRGDSDGPRPAAASGSRRNGR